MNLTSVSHIASVAPILMGLAACGGGGGDGGNDNGSAAPTPAPAFLYFKAEDSVSGDELWKTDGTEAGTVLVKDICQPNCSSSPSGFSAF